MKSWLLALLAFVLLGIPGTMFVANVLTATNEVNITAVVEDPNALVEEETPVVVPVITDGGNGSGGSGRGGSDQDSDSGSDSDSESIESSEGISDQTNASSSVEGSSSGGSSSPTSSAPVSAPESVEEQALEASIFFGGYAFPNATVRFSIDGNSAVTAMADGAGYFQGSFSGVHLGDHIFSFQAADYSGEESRLVSYSYTVQNESPLYISSIFLPPIFAPASSGDTLTGVSIPGSEILVYGVSQMAQDLVLLDTIQVPEDGSYSYAVDLKSEGFDQYYVACNFKGKACGFSGIIPVQNIGVGDEIPTNIFADFTNDISVNFVDFSFMRAAFLSDVSILFYDLDEDGELTVKDFSLLNYHWTQ